jgi:hypothetical protein
VIEVFSNGPAGNLLDVLIQYLPITGPLRKIFDQREELLEVIGLDTNGALIHRISSKKQKKTGAGKSIDLPAPVKSITGR